MNFNQTVKYNLKRMLPILGIAGATLLPACRGHQNEPEPKTGVDTPKVEIQKRDTTLYFYYLNYDEISTENVQKTLDNKNIANIYLEANKPIDFTASTPRFITAIRKQALEPALNLDSTRVFGRGDIIFHPGWATPEDSLWFVQHGWTVNPQNQR